MKLLADLERNECRWAVDEDDGTFLFCGAGVKPGRPYCACHDRLSRPIQPLKLYGRRYVRAYVGIR